MKRSLATATLLAVLLAACSDNSSPTLPKLTATSGVAASRSATIDGLILQLFPKGLETATGARWDKIDAELGTWNATTSTWTGADAATGLKHTMDLVKFINLKTGDIDAQAIGSETKEHAASRLVAAMLTYVMDGPNATLPPPTASADVVYAVVPAGSAATVVTPSNRAGVQIPAGATNEDRIIVVAQNSAVPPGPCAGPLTYTGCQYAPYYRFESLPHLKLNAPAKFIVCIDWSNTYAPTAAQHERARLAHTLPTNSDNYTPGATQVQGIEILPLSTAQSGFLKCGEPPAPPVIGLKGLGERTLYELARLGGKIFSPKNLYAYDQGPEHDGVFFSDFNAVDPVTNAGCVSDCPNPVLALRSIQPQANGTYYNITVTNRADYSDVLFAAAPTLPPCGANTNSSRTWVDIYNAATNTRIYGFCSLGAADNLNLMWYFVPNNAAPPSAIYIKMVDRLTNTTYTSNTLTVIPAMPTPVLALKSVEPGATNTVYNLTVTNRADIADAYFFPYAHSCTSDPSATSARTWVEIHDGSTNAQLYGFCQLSAAGQLDNIWVSLANNSSTSSLYIILHDYATGNTYQSNTIQIVSVPNPVLAYRHSEQYSTSGGDWDRYGLTVVNRADIPNYLFTSTGAPACGSRSDVNIYDGTTNQYIYGFCALGSNADLNNIWFATSRWVQPPSSVYIKIVDKQTNAVYTSNTINLYGPLFVNYPREVSLSWNAVSGAASYDVEVDYCESWASPDWRTCNTPWVSYIRTSAAGTSYTATFVGDQPGRWRVQARDGNGAAIGSPTAYKFFTYITGPGAP